MNTIAIKTEKSKYALLQRQAYGLPKMKSPRCSVFSQALYEPIFARFCKMGYCGRIKFFAGLKPTAAISSATISK